MQFGDDTYHGAVSCALAQHHVALPRDLSKGAIDLLQLLVVRYLPVDVPLCVPPRNDHRAHVPVVNVIEVELLLEQADVLVHPYVLAEGRGVDGDVLLPDGLDEPHAVKALLEAAHEGEGGGGLADVLLGGGDEDGTGLFPRRREWAGADEQADWRGGASASGDGDRAGG